MSEHAPEPWSLAEDGSAENRRLAIEDANGVWVCDVRPWGSNARSQAAQADTAVRIRDAVNACKDLKNPSALPGVVDALRTTLGNIRSLKHNVGLGIRTFDEWEAAVAGALNALDGTKTCPSCGNAKPAGEFDAAWGHCLDCEEQRIEHAARMNAEEGR